MTKRKVAAISLPDTERATLTGAPPECRMVAPTDLYVDEVYQRGLSSRSIRLIAKIVKGWDWSAFKPPIVQEVDGMLDVIDGQHTAIAAATHGGIPAIPVMVSPTEAISGRATAFVRHNRNRVSVTPLQIHTAMVAAGDEDAMTVAQVCERAGVRILRSVPPTGRYSPGDTLAVSAIRMVVNRRFAVGARKVLDVCVASGSAPISADLIKAVELLLFADEYRNDITPEQVALVVKALGPKLAQRVDDFARSHTLAKWRATAAVIFQHSAEGRYV